MISFLKNPKRITLEILGSGTECCNLHCVQILLNYVEIFKGSWHSPRNFETNLRIVKFQHIFNEILITLKHYVLPSSTSFNQEIEEETCSLTFQSAYFLEKKNYTQRGTKPVMYESKRTYFNHSAMGTVSYRDEYLVFL